MRRARQKRQAANLVFVVAFCLVAGLGTLIPQLTNSMGVFIPALFAIGILLIVGIGFMVWRTEQNRRAKFRALQLADIDHMNGVEFERYIGGILKSQSYRVRYTAITGDYGVDLLAEKNHRTYAIQAKRYTGSVGNHAIMEANTGKTHYKAHKAVVITNSSFTPYAYTLAVSTDTKLVDRNTLAEWVLIFQNNQRDKKISLE
jgi:restriction system protein